MGACASVPTETKTETMMMTLASEVRDLRALVVETSVRTVEETRAAAASAETSGRKEREKLTSTLTEKTLECEKLRRERDLIVADAKCEASGAVRAMREELESLRARALERAEHFDRERERKSRELEELDGHVALAMDVLRKTLEEEVVRARCRESSPLKTSRSRDTPTSAPTSPRSETSRSLEQSFDRSLARSTRETEEEIETRVRERYESKFRDLEAHAETLRARCESLDERLARDRLALLDAAGALETRARLVSTLRSRIESLEDREHEHRKFSGERVAIGTTTRSSVLAFAA